VAEDRVDRRLAAIFAGDIAGYSRLMGADEEGTLRQLKAHRKELVDPKITEHRGGIVKTTGWHVGGICRRRCGTASFFRRWRTAGMRLRSASEPPS
jgi:class 3 adenylate cyclase